MSILNSTPSEPTREQKLTTAIDKIKGLTTYSYERLVEIQKDGIRAVWNHPEFTPQEICDALGADAVKVFAYHGQLTDMIVEVCSAEGVVPDVLTPSNAFSIVNGLVVISANPYTP